MKFKFAIIVLMVLLGEATAALPAPYLISATPLGDTAGRVAWRNNSVAYQGIVIIRKSQGDASFTAIDTVAYPGSEFIDQGLAASTRYFYALHAYSAAEASDTSNIDSLVTQDPPGCLRPLVTNHINLLSGPCFLKYDTAGSTISLDYTDSACDETGLVVYRTVDFGAFNVYRTIVHGDPSYLGKRTWTDSTVEPNRWYGYKLGLFNSQDTILVETGSVFTLNAPAFFGARQIVLHEKRAEFPVYFGGWALRSGDTIVVKEFNSADPTLINIANRDMPVFEGYIRTKEFTSVFVMNDCLLEKSGNAIRAFRFRGGAFTLVDSIVVPLISTGSAWLRFEWLGMLNDSTVLVRMVYSLKGGTYILLDSYIFPLSFNGIGFSPIDTVLLETSTSDSYLPSPIAICNNKAFLQWDMWDYGISLADPPRYRLSCSNYQEAAIGEFGRKMVHGMITNDERLTGAAAVLLSPGDSTAYLFGSGVMTVFSYGTIGAVPAQVRMPPMKTPPVSTEPNLLHISRNGSQFVITFRNPGKRASITVSDLQGRQYYEFSGYAGEVLLLDAGRLAKKIFVVQIVTASMTTRGVIKNNQGTR